VHYRDHWLWVDDTNWQTKRAMTAIMFFFTLADTGSKKSCRWSRSWRSNRTTTEVRP
jgi:hypothetical protein